MPLPAWPSIPAPDWGTEEEVYLPQVRTDFEANYAQSRPKVTRQKGRWPLGWSILSEAEYQTLLAFFLANQGGSFTWTHPLAGSSHTCRFSADSIRSAWGSPGYRKSVQCPIEEV